MPALKKYPTELKERAVRLVIESRDADGGRRGACTRIGQQRRLHNGSVSAEGCWIRGRLARSVLTIFQAHLGGTAAWVADRCALHASVRVIHTVPRWIAGALQSERSTAVGTADAPHVRAGLWLAVVLAFVGPAAHRGKPAQMSLPRAADPISAREGVDLLN